MIVLDTNVVSELMKPAPAETVLRWTRRQAPSTLLLTAISLLEIRYGLALLPKGRRKSGLGERFDAFLDRGFRDRIVPFDEPAARISAEILVERRGQGRPMDGNLPDALIASIARVRSAKIATRDIGDFDGCGVELINPWTGVITSNEIRP